MSDFFNRDLVLLLLVLALVVEWFWHWCERDRLRDDLRRERFLRRSSR